MAPAETESRRDADARVVRKADEQMTRRRISILPAAAGVVAIAGVIFGAGAAGLVPGARASGSAPGSSRTPAVNSSAGTVHVSTGTVHASTVPNTVTISPDSGLPYAALTRAQCPFRSTSTAAPAPAGVSLARLANPPASITDSVSIAFTGGCSSTLYQRVLPGVAPLLLNPGVIMYSGKAGAVVLKTVKPTAEALKIGLDMGDRDGQLPDGTPLYSRVVSAAEGLGTGPGLYANNLLFQRNGFVVVVSSSDLSLDQLKSLAASVVVL